MRQHNYELIKGYLYSHSLLADEPVVQVGKRIAQTLTQQAMPENVVYAFFIRNINLLDAIAGIK